MEYIRITQRGGHDDLTFDVNQHHHRQHKRSYTKIMWIVNWFWVRYVCVCDYTEMTCADLVTIATGCSRLARYVSTLCALLYRLTDQITKHVGLAHKNAKILFLGLDNAGKTVSAGRVH